METDISHYIKSPFSGVARLISKDADTEYIKGTKLITMGLDRQELSITGMELT